MTHDHAGGRPPLTLLLLLPVAVVSCLGLGLVRGMTYRAAVGWAATLPGWVQETLHAVSEYGLLVLVALFGAAALAARARGLAHLARGVAAGVGVVLAYLVSEVIKVVVSERRPCHTLEVTSIATCPPADDWSWPSNHATIAVAIAVAVLLVSGGLGAAAMPLAALVGASRVVVGVHYAHDVVAGAALGATVVMLCATWGTPAVGRLLTLVRSGPLGRLLEPAQSR